MDLTYSLLRPRNLSVLVGSSFTLLIVVNACVFGLLAVAIVISSGGATRWVSVPASCGASPGSSAWVERVGREQLHRAAR
jgi:hypothetical protein